MRAPAPDAGTAIDEVNKEPVDQMESADWAAARPAGPRTDEMAAEPHEPATSTLEFAAVQPNAPTPAETVTAGSYMVQLASYRSEARAMKGWTELRAAASDLLDGVEPVVRRVDLGGDKGTFYQLRAGPATKDDAQALCTELRARDVDCLVTKEPRAGAGSGSISG